MGGKQSIFTEEELEDYQTLTYFTKKEILHAFKRFSELESDQNVPITRETKFSQDKMMLFPELMNNPFKERICKVFSADGTGNMDFNDFVSMASTFSDAAPANVKTEYAFEIYDFDGDGHLSESDLRQTIICLLGKNELEEEDIVKLIDNIFEEADMDEDRSLSFAEFEHVISKAPDFASTFRMRI